MVMGFWNVHYPEKVARHGGMLCYRPRSKGDNTFGSVRPSVCPFAQPGEQVVFFNNNNNLEIQKTLSLMIQ